MDRSGDHRVLPGDLVTFATEDADVLLVKPTQRKARSYDNTRADWSFANDAEKNRLADMLENSRAVSRCMFYLVLSASKQRAFLMRSDTLQYVVALTKDVRLIQMGRVS